MRFVGLLLRPARGAKYCDERVVSVRLSVCLSVCLSARISENHVSKHHEIICTCYLWPWLGPSLMRTQCVMCTPGSVDDVTLAQNRKGKGDVNRAYTQTDSPGGSTGGQNVVSVLCRVGHSRSN